MWEEGLDLAMGKQPAGEQKGRIPVPEGGRKPVLREARCPFNDVFLKEGSIPLLKSFLPSSMSEISIVSQRIP